jgi:hypothetical protein
LDAVYAAADGAATESLRAVLGDSYDMDTLAPLVLDSMLLEPLEGRHGAARELLSPVKTKSDIGIVSTALQLLTPPRAMDLNLVSQVLTAARSLLPENTPTVLQIKLLELVRIVYVGAPSEEAISRVPLYLETASRFTSRLVVLLDTAGSNDLLVKRITHLLEVLCVSVEYSSALTDVDAAMNACFERLQSIPLEARSKCWKALAELTKRSIMRGRTALVPQMLGSCWDYMVQQNRHPQDFALLRYSLLLGAAVLHRGTIAPSSFEYLFSVRLPSLLQFSSSVSESERYAYSLAVLRVGQLLILRGIAYVKLYALWFPLYRDLAQAYGDSQVPLLCRTVLEAVERAALKHDSADLTALLSDGVILIIKLAGVCEGTDELGRLIEHVANRFLHEGSYDLLLKVHHAYNFVRQIEALRAGDMNRMFLGLLRRGNRDDAKLIYTVFRSELKRECYLLILQKLFEEAGRSFDARAFRIAFTLLNSISLTNRQPKAPPPPPPTDPAGVAAAAVPTGTASASPNAAAALGDAGAAPNPPAPTAPMGEAEEELPTAAPEIAAVAISAFEKLVSEPNWSKSPPKLKTLEQQLMHFLCYKATRFVAINGAPPRGPSLEDFLKFTVPEELVSDPHASAVVMSLARRIDHARIHNPRRRHVVSRAAALLQALVDFEPPPAGDALSRLLARQQHLEEQVASLPRHAEIRQHLLACGYSPVLFDWRSDIHLRLELKDSVADLEAAHRLELAEHLSGWTVLLHACNITTVVVGGAAVPLDALFTKTLSLDELRSHRAAAAAALSRKVPLINSPRSA